ncbi:MAG: RdgB/HAM1 family non-canonical purine NTP pyrophosphatase [Clostridiales bacterium]|jgi:XTP/dITP diphosphohydrolase|nr:RdgB/HAM1 family non-canonical purine NTP pyrophosphatase [Clostridiales bacterium]
MSAPFKVIFATRNEHKLREVRAIFTQTPILPVSMAEAGIDLDVVEDGATFHDNAVKKCVAIAAAADRPVMSDDSGLEIDFLDKGPGVYSARFLGESTPYDIKNAEILKILRDVPWQQRTARYVCVIAFARPGEKPVTTRGTLEGFIAWEARGSGGFGYDPVFFLPEYNRTVAEIPPEAKNRISHRAVALSLMKEKLLEINV